MQSRIVENQVRSLGAADIGGCKAQICIDLIDPGARRIDHYIRNNKVGLSAQLVLQVKRGAGSPRQGAMVECQAAGVGFHAVEQQF